MPKQSINIYLCGAIGSGKSTLGHALSKTLSCPLIEADDHFWLPTHPPFTVKRGREERVRMLAESLSGSNGWVLAGNIGGWGDCLVHLFHVAVFLRVLTQVRLERVHARELQQHGATPLTINGAMHTQYQRLMKWAAEYDNEGPNGRGLRFYEKWLSTLPCPVLHLEGDLSTSTQIQLIFNFITNRLSTVPHN